MYDKAFNPAARSPVEIVALHCRAMVGLPKQLKLQQPRAPNLPGAFIANLAPPI